MIDVDGNILSLKAKNIFDGKECVITNIYAPNSKSTRSKFWDKIQQKRNFFPLNSWVMMGDFNTSLQDIDKYGGIHAQPDNRSNLMNFININALIDMDLNGASYTWSNQRDGEDLIQVRLDRSLVTNDWILSHRCSLSIINRIGSDHYPISFVADNFKNNQSFPFWFEKMWISHPNHEKSITNWWNIDVNGTTMYKVAKKLKNIKVNIKIWNKKVFGDIFDSKKKLKEELDQIQNSIQKDGYKKYSKAMEDDVLVKLHNIISREEIYWRQRSRVIWLEAGDRNTKFFHMTSLKHKAVNRISKLIVEEKTLLNKEEIRDEADRFFNQLLTSNKDIDHTHQHNLVNIIPKIINPIQNKALSPIPSTAEI